MTVAAAERVAGPFATTGGETLLPYAFRILAAEDLAVWRRRGGGEVRLTLSVDYIVTGVGAASGGNVTLLEAALDGDLYFVEGDRPQVRITDLVYNRAQPPAALNPEFDSLQIQLREVRDRLQRTIVRSRFDDASLPPLELPPVEPGKIIGFDAAGDIDLFDQGAGGGGGGGIPNPLPIDDGGTGGNTAAEARTNLELGDLAVQDAVTVEQMPSPTRSFVAQSRSLSQPPVSPSVGQIWRVGAAPLAGAWSAYTPQVDLARCTAVTPSVAWERLVPADGWEISVRDAGDEVRAHFLNGSWRDSVDIASIGTRSTQRTLEIRRSFPSGTAPATVVIGAWTAVPWNTLVANYITEANGASGDCIFLGTAGSPTPNVSLSRGRRKIKTRVPFAPSTTAPTFFRIRIRNVTTGNVLVTSAPIAAGGLAQVTYGHEPVETVLDVEDASEVIVVEYFSTAGGTLGRPAGTASTNEEYGWLGIDDLEGLAGPKGLKGDQGIPGDTAGPAGAVDNQLALFSGASGKLLKALALGAVGSALIINGAGAPEFSLFSQGIAGAADRTWMEKAREVEVSIADFTGADPTGATSSLAALQAAQQALPFSGGVIAFPSGDWLIPAEFVATKAITFKGRGPFASRLITNHASNTILKLASGCVVDGLGFASTVVRTGGQYIDCDTVIRWKIRNFYMNGHFLGIRVHACAIQVIENGEFRDAAGGIGCGHISLTGGSVQTTLFDLTADKATLPQPEFGIEMTHTDATQMFGLDIIRSGKDLLVRPGSGQVVTSTKIIASYFDSADYGMVLQTSGTGVIQYFQADASWTSSHASRAISVDTSVGGSIWAEFINHQAHLNTGSSIVVDGPNSFVRIRGGGVGANGGDGILTGSTVPEIEIDGVKIGASDNQPTNAGAAVKVLGASTLLTLVNSDLRGNTGGALSNASSNPGCLIANNKGIANYYPEGIHPFISGAKTLGNTSNGWAALHGHTGFELNVSNSNWRALHSTGLLDVTHGEMRIQNPGTHAKSVVTLGQIKEKLAAARTYYVRIDGNDANSGLADTAGGAFRTLQKAWTAILALDQGGFEVTVIVRDGTYNAGLAATSAPSGPVTFQGNNAAPSNCVISTVGDCFMASYSGPRLRIRYFRMTSSGAGLVSASSGANVNLDGNEFGAAAGSHIRCVGASVVLTGAYKIAGGGHNHMQALLGGRIEASTNAVDFLASPAFSVAFANADTCGVISAFGMVFSAGVVTGTRYSATLNGAINTYSGGSATYFPGSSAGVTALGGQYA